MVGCECSSDCLDLNISRPTGIRRCCYLSGRAMQPAWTLGRAVVLNLGYVYPRGYAKTSNRVSKIEKKNIS
jgi:hypothetical protein